VLQDEVKALRARMRASQKLIHKDALKQMKRVLRRLGHTDENDVVMIKGSVACRINSADELLVTELLFNGVFNELDVPSLVALMSVFSGGDRAKKDADGGEEKVRPELREPLRLLKEGARRVAKVSQESGMEVDVKEYEEKFNVELMEVAYMWASGAKFSEICKFTDQFEGSIIRSIRRLEEVLREVAAACKAVGSDELAEKFKKGILAIKRDIVFAASLYL
jgi:ATP-dependent RNA helicase DOB1